MPGIGEMREATVDQRLERSFDELRQKLLDLSLRNPMLNFKHSPRSKRFLQIVDTNLDPTYCALVELEKSLRIEFLKDPDDIPKDEQTKEFVAALAHARVSDVEFQVALASLENTGRDDEHGLAEAERALRDRVREKLDLPPKPDRKTTNPAERARELKIDPSYDLKTSLKAENVKSLQTLKWSDVLESTLERIADAARLSEQEAGLSTLFLAFGFLEWKDHPNQSPSSKSCFAPLLLLPVNLSKKRDRRGKLVFDATTQADGADENLSLQKRFERFGIKLPDFESPESAENPIDGYLNKIEKSIADFNEFRVRRWLTLGNFAFGRSAMYADLEPTRWIERPTSKRLVGSILRGYDTVESENFGNSIEYEIDDPKFESIAPVLIQDADSSQHSALIDVMKGTDLVVQGPPGTGKSQTITNIIANALYADKTILFVAEKQAALDVVKRRLERSGLGNFCLELHSNKASSKTAVEQLKRRYSLRGKAAKSLGNEPARKRSRDSLVQYFAAISDRSDDHVSPFGAIWRGLRERSKWGEAVLSSLTRQKALKDVIATDESFLELMHKIRIWSDLCRSFTASFGPLNQSPWNFVWKDKSKPLSRTNLLDRIEDANHNEIEIAEAVRLAQSIGLSESDIFELAKKADGYLPETAPSWVVMSRTIEVDRAQLKSYLHDSEVRLDVLDKIGKYNPAATIERRTIENGNRLFETITQPQFRELTPLQVKGAAQIGLARALTIEAWAKEANIALGAFNLDKSFPSDGIATAWSFLYALHKAQITRDTFAFINLDTVISLDLQSAEAERIAIVEAEKEWRNKFPAVGKVPWPRVEELNALAQHLNKNSLIRIISARGDKRAFLESIAYDLGITTADSNKDRAIENLARHVALSSDYLTNRGFRKLAGQGWNGFATPFSTMLRGVKLREQLSKALKTLSRGDDVLRAFCSLTPEQFEALHLIKLPKIQIPIDAEAFEHVSGMSIGGAAQFAAQTKAAMEKILNVTNLETLEEFKLPILDLKTLFDLSVQRLDVEAKIALSGLHRTLRFLDRAQLEEHHSCMAWMESVDTCGLPKDSARRLLSSDAQRVRENLKQVATKGWERHRAAMDIRTAALLENNAEIPSGQEAVSVLNNLITRKHELIDFAAISGARSDLNESGLAKLLGAAEKANIPEDKIDQLVEALIAQERAKEAIESQSTLKSATGAKNDAARRSFITLDREKLTADRESIFLKLIKKVPPTGSNAGPRRAWTELQLLQNEFGKTQRFLPLRALLSSAARAVQTLTPCIMMSPLSLAKFLPSDRVTFDLLVIDEASQMRPEDALGAMLRSKQIVVVGDQKQLPPTDFFSRGSDAESTDEEEELLDDVTNNESILEITGKTFKASRRLRWHYRSRCESLIAFSNKHFYDGELITFPSSKTGSFSVELVKVDGYYQGRLNEREAQVVAEKAVKFMREHAHLKGDDLPSLGIVALNSDQRELIAEEIQQLSSDDELVEKYKSNVETKGEELFVKNLENVQGDERDYILISLTYGPAPGQNNVLQRFGPINGKAGHRRLNVLFSRAREKMVLFTSMSSADVQTSETSNEGRLALKNYLEYAESGGRVAPERVGGETDSDFEVEVAERLRAKGYEVDTQIGVSGFRIDLGVKDKTQPGQYVVGIECDGATYHSSKSARDRDRLRQEVLEGLGWKILRIWSTDWFENPDVMTDRLVREIEAMPRRTIDSTGFRFGDLADTRIEDVDDIAKDAPFDRSLIVKDTPLSTEQAISILIMMRDQLLAFEVKDFDIRRSILRDDMIEFMARNQVTSFDDWERKIPQFLTARTNPKEKKYLPDVCSVLSRITDRLENLPLNEIIGVGEGSETEFKSSLRTNLHTGQHDQGREKDVLKTIAAFLNTRGGYLFIGIADDGKLVGNDVDRFPNEDKMRLHLKNLIADKIGAAQMMFIDMKHMDYQSGRILVVSCRKARSAVFLKDGNVDRFFIRTDAASTELGGEKMLSYIQSYMEKPENH